MQTQEAIQTYLLEKRDRIKLQLLEVLLQSSHYLSIPQLAGEIALTDATTSNYLKEIAAELTENGFTSQLSLAYPLVKLEIAEDPLACYTKMMAGYCARSVHYLILATLLKKETTSMTKLSQALNFSSSYLYARLKLINQFLALFGISVSFTSNGQKKITGSEIQLHYCLLNIYWTIYTNTQLTTSDSSRLLRQAFKPSLLTDNGQLDKLAVLLDLFQRNYPYKSLPLIQAELAEHPHCRLFLAPELDVLNPTFAASREQRILLNILVRLSLAKVENNEDNLQQFAFLEARRIPLFQFSKSLVETFAETFELVWQEEERVTAILNMVRHRLYSEYLYKAQPNTILPSFTLSRSDPDFLPLLEKINAFCQQFQQDQPSFQSFFATETTHWLLEDLFSLYDRYHAKRAIQIGINYTKDYYVGEDLLGKLSQLFANEHIHFQKAHFDDCDVVITDCPLQQVAATTETIDLVGDALTPAGLNDLVAQLAQILFQLRNQVKLPPKKAAAD